MTQPNPAERPLPLTESNHPTDLTFLFEDSAEKATLLDEIRSIVLDEAKADVFSPSPRIFALIFDLPEAFTLRRTDYDRPPDKQMWEAVQTKALDVFEAAALMTGKSRHDVLNIMRISLNETTRAKRGRRGVKTRAQESPRLQKLLDYLVQVE